MSKRKFDGERCSLISLLLIVVIATLIFCTDDASAQTANTSQIFNVYGKLIYQTSSKTSMRELVEEAVHSGVDLSNANLVDSNLEEAILSKGRFHGADFTAANLHGAVLDAANLSATHLERTDLRVALLLHADLSGAVCYQCEMTDINLGLTKMHDFVFEPKDLPPPEQIVRVSGLDTVRFVGNPSALFRLKTVLQTNGFVTADKQVITAINRSFDTLSLIDQNSPMSVRISAMIRKLLFDDTAGYGSDIAKPFQLIAIIMTSCSIYYWSVLRFGFGGRRDGIFINVTGRPKRSRSGYDGWKTATTTRLLLLLRTRHTASSMVRRESKFIYAALMFSIMSSARIGFREINVGTWLSYILPRDFVYIAIGRPRIISGLQSLSSIYLIALAVLSFFGRPFDV